MTAGAFRRAPARASAGNRRHRSHGIPRRRTTPPEPRNRSARSESRPRGRIPSGPAVRPGYNCRRARPVGRSAASNASVSRLNTFNADFRGDELAFSTPNIQHQPSGFSRFFRPLKAGTWVPFRQVLHNFYHHRTSLPPPPFARQPGRNPSLSCISRTTSFPYPWDQTAPRTSLGGWQLAYLRPNSHGSLPRTRETLPATRFTGPTSLRGLPCLTSTKPHLPTKSPSGFSFMLTPFERSSATSLATPTSTLSSPPSGPAQIVPQTRCDPRPSRALCRQGATLADIHAVLQREGFDVSESYLFRSLHRGLGRGTATSSDAPTG